MNEAECRASCQDLSLYAGSLDPRWFWKLGVCTSRGVQGIIVQVMFGCERTEIICLETERHFKTRSRSPELQMRKPHQ